MTAVEQTIKDLERRFSLIMQTEANDNPLLMGAIHGYIGVTKNAISISPIWHHFEHEEHDKFENEFCQKIKNNQDISEEERSTRIWQSADFYFAPAYDALCAVYEKIEMPDAQKNLRYDFRYNEKHYQNLMRRIHPVIIGKLEEELAKGKQPEKSKLDKDFKVEFLPEKTALHVGQYVVQLPPYKNEYDLCRVMFQSVVDEPIDWSLIYEEMSKKEESKEKAKRRVYDACLAVNRRIKEMTGLEDFFIWEIKTVRRKY